ncbi:MAG TPA: hypothetical protein DDY70_02040, partial [Clostridiales bacterium]|nr:hypothetical protein [Clostridiales bacterium]
MKKIGILLSFITLFLMSAAFSSFAVGTGADALSTPEVGYDTGKGETEESISDGAPDRGAEDVLVLASSSSARCEIRAEGEEYLLTDSAGEEVARDKDLQPLIDTVPSGTALSFSSVTTRKTLTVSARHLAFLGAVTFEGNAGLVLSDGTSLEIVGATLRFSTGGIRVKEGVLSFSSGHIESLGSAVLLDYSSDAKFLMTGGEILTSGDDPSVRNRLGTVSVSGGEIRNSGGCAVSSEGTLRLGGTACLSGRETDAVATLPITLTAEGTPFSGSLSVRLNETFEKGKETLAFYGACAGMETRISLTDKNGDACPLVYRERGEDTDEKNYLAVYLPYRYSFTVDGREIAALYGLSGKALTPPDAPTKSGYSFDGWYTDVAMTEKMDFSAPPTEDTTLYAKMTLLPPTFTIGALSFTYDGELHDLTFLALSHALSEEGLFSFAWYHDGALCPSSAKALKLRNVSDAGSYVCKITFTKGRDSVTVTTPEIKVTVEKKQIRIPDPDAKIYNGNKQFSSLYDTADYTVSENEGGISVGEYPVILRLTDPDNCAFVGSDGAYVTLSFRILRAENIFLGDVGIPDYFESGQAAPFAKSRFGTPEFYYAESPDGEYRREAPT